MIKGYYDRDAEMGCHSNELMADALTLLKEQEAVEPVRDKETGRIWLCGKCGSYVGFEDNDENDPNEFDNTAANVADLFCGKVGEVNG